MHAGLCVQTLNARSNHLPLSEEFHVDGAASRADSCPTYQPPSAAAGPSSGVRWVLNPRYEYALPAGLALDQASEDATASIGSDGTAAEAEGGAAAITPSHAAAARARRTASQEGPGLLAAEGLAEVIEAALAKGTLCGTMGDGESSGFPLASAHTAALTMYDATFTNAIYDESGYAATDSSGGSEAGTPRTRTRAAARAVYAGYAVLRRLGHWRGAAQCGVQQAAAAAECSGGCDRSEEVRIGKEVASAPRWPPAARESASQHVKTQHADGESAPVPQVSIHSESCSGGESGSGFMA